MAVVSAAGVELLLDVGLERRITGSAEVEISVGDGQWSRRRVLLLRHSPSPTEVDRALASTTKTRYDGVYFVVGTAGSALTDAAERDPRVAYAAVDDGVVSFLGRVYQTGDHDPGIVPRPTRVSWTRLAILRLFALRPQETWTQSAIANRIGVSHVAVGKQLPSLGGLVERKRDGWRAPNRAACWDRFMASYPGPEGLANYFAATGEAAEQLARIEPVVRTHCREKLAVSGDFAADFYAPWRRPDRIVGYVSVQPPLDQHGFAVVRVADATVELRIPRDLTILPMSCTYSLSGSAEGRRYADPLIAAWDLSRSAGGDVESAVAHLRDRAMREIIWS
jgi:hypothetical protein